jgi:uncharacterized membrane protein
MYDAFIYHTPLLYVVQSLWRDEAFSVILAQYAISDIIQLTAGDFTPPLYYLILHVWIYLFGSSEIAVRLLSTCFYSLLLPYVYIFIRQIDPRKKSWLPLLATCLVSINPMIVYYAFEARAYMLMVLLTVMTTVYFLQTKWRWYVVCATCGLYTHPYIVFILLVHVLYMLYVKNKTEIRTFLMCALVIIVLYIPWLFTIYFQIQRGGSMWFFPVDVNLIQAVLGNIYTGYEGTPHFFWQWSKVLSLAIMSAIVSGVLYPSIRKDYRFFLLAWLIVPLGIVISVSFVRPIFVARYILYTTIAEIILITIGIYAIRYAAIRTFVLSFVFVGTLWFNVWYAPYHQKVDFQSSFRRIQKTYEKGDYILATSALSYFESYYYAQDSDYVFLYNPLREQLPSYVGSVLIPDERHLSKLPGDHTSYLVSENGSYETIIPLP